MLLSLVTRYCQYFLWLYTQYSLHTDVWKRCHMKNSKEILRLDDIHYQIDRQVILDSVSFGLNKGEFKLITDPSGYGKSTLLKIASSLIDPTSGSITFDGKAITAMPPEEYRKRVSYCFQTPVLFGNTVYDNIALIYLIRKQQPDEQKMKAYLARFRLPDSMVKKASTNYQAVRNSASR